MTLVRDLPVPPAAAQSTEAARATPPPFNLPEAASSPAVSAPAVSAPAPASPAPAAAQLATPPEAAAATASSVTPKGPAPGKAKAKQAEEPLVEKPPPSLVETLRMQRVRKFSEKSNPVSPTSSPEKAESSVSAAAKRKDAPPEGEASDPGNNPPQSPSKRGASL